MSKGQLNYTKFPENFAFGIASSAYQIEGGWNEDGKGENAWDRFLHDKPNRTSDGRNGDVACNSYHRYHEDIKMLRYLGVKHYRLSLSWSRILPTGYIYRVNRAGVKYYKRIIKALKKNGIEPYVTLHQWDLPQRLQEIGGWLNPALIELFADYARLVFTLYGCDVKNWLTFNAPNTECPIAYEMDAESPPGYQSQGIGTYMCGHTVIKAHALAYHIYDKEFRSTQKGRISIVLNGYWFEPASDSKQDNEAAERMSQFDFGWLAHPIYSTSGNYPQIMIERIGNRSREEGFTRSRLPEFTSEEIDYIKGTSDRMCINTYTARLVEWVSEYEIGDPSWDADKSVKVFANTSWQNTSSPMVKVVPWGIRKLLNWIHRTYNGPEIFITENGYPDDGQLYDVERIDYLSKYLKNILLSIIEDNVNVTGYTLWSLMDSFEWMLGYTAKYGLYSVNFNSSNRIRRKKMSTDYYRKLIADRSLANN